MIKKGSKVLATVHGKRQECRVTWLGIERGQNMALVETYSPMNISAQRVASLELMQ